MILQKDPQKRPTASQVLQHEYFSESTKSHGTKEEKNQRKNSQKRKNENNKENRNPKRQRKLN